MDLSHVNLVLSLLLCLSWSHPLNNTTDDPECNDTDYCGPDRACVNLKCVDPCQGVCGINSACQVINLIPICSCKPGFTGHPFTGCFSGHEPECSGNIQCGEDRACVNQRCVDPCVGSCGVNTECRVINHYPVCACSEGFVWNLPSGCQPKTVPQCNSNEQCTADRACINQKCVDPCAKVCGNNTVCNVTNHYPACACSPGYTGNPFIECKLLFSSAEPQCNSNEQCTLDRACINQKCVDPCARVCGNNTVCNVTNHYPACACSPGFTGNPFIDCKLLFLSAVPQCNSNEQCTTDRACINQKCVDPCAGVCGNNTVCNVTNHYPACACSPGYTGNPFNECKLLFSSGVEQGKGLITRSPQQGKKKYYVAKTSMEWRVALHYCHAKGMDLVSIDNALEQAEVNVAIRESGEIGDFWSSGVQMGGSGEFFWASTGSPLSYKNWVSGEPTGSEEYCMEIRVSKEGKWRSYRCKLPQNVICEYYQD